MEINATLTALWLEKDYSLLYVPLRQWVGHPDYKKFCSENC